MRAEAVGNRLKLQHLKIVMAVAEWGSMQKAAKHLAISQPVVSKMIADLEDILGVRLFDRSPRGVELTAYGRTLLKRSLAIFDDLRTGVDEIKFMADPAAGQLRFGSTEPLTAGFGAAVMERVWRQYPRVDFRVVQADSATLIEHELPERRIELAVVPLLNVPDDDELETTILFQDRLRVVAGATNRLAKRRRVTLAELIEEPWCLAPSPLGSLVNEGFRTAGLKAPRIAVTTTTSHLLFRLLESGRFVGHFGDKLLSFNVNRFALKKLPIELPIQPFVVAVITLKNRTISPVAQVFINHAIDVARPLADRDADASKEQSRLAAGRRLA